MQTKTFIQNQANVVRFTALKVGDVFKMVEKPSYSSETNVYLGVVIDLMNNGKQTFIQVMRFKKQYSGVEIEIKTYNGEDDLSLFPSSVEEVQKYFDECVQTLEERVKDRRKELNNEIENLNRLKELATVEGRKALHDSRFTQITQGEFDELTESEQALITEQ